MKSGIAFLAMALLTACGADPASNGNEVTNSPAAENVAVNAMENGTIEVDPAEQNVAAGEGEAAPAPAAKTSTPTTPPPARERSATPPVKPAQDPPARDQAGAPATPAPAPSPTPKTACTPEHAAMGHCRP